MTVIPNYNKILTEEMIMLTCDVESDASGCSWYHENILIYTGKDYVISMTEIRHSGDYQCQNSAGERSEIVTLNVTTGPVILQAPPLVYWGSDVVLRCHSHPGYGVIKTTFYKDGDIIQPSTNDLATVIIPRNQQVGRYRCTRTLSWEEYVTYTDEVSLHIRGENHKVDYTTVNIIRLALSGYVLFMACVFLIHHIKAEVITPSKG
ncbi:hypothetical protein AB205_0102240 [Aquarana catesbeiana]|uniref:Ig-like domain-containing protein n=1 Tax=Aquarana catesbeiana TaxID=8400 RepID=A0A2G9QKG0_AQUCT|nr:hypothetical protein AB205_0102240 [Aquarana catesbeiana]